MNVDHPASHRPPLDEGITGAEFGRWYWLKEELVVFARRLGIPASGSKQDLADRIRGRLDGEAVEATPVTSRRAGRQLSGTLSSDTVIPPGQRCSQAVREWLVREAGDRFHFDAPMRAFFADADGTTTLGDALAHYRSTRSAGPREIDAQFEYNRFTRAWRSAHPDRPRSELLAAWREYRDTPVGVRGRA